MKFEHFISLKFIINSQNRDIKNSSKTLIFAVSLSIIFYIISVSIMNGYIEGTTQFALNIKSYHVQLKNLNSYDNAKNYSDFFQENILTKYSTVIAENNCLLSYKNREKAISFLRSVEENIFETDITFNNSIKLLEGAKDLSINKIMITDRIKNRLKINIGDTIYLATYNPFVLRKVTVSGIFTTGLSDYDDQFSLIGMETSKNIFKNNRYSVYIKLNDYNKTNDFIRQNVLKGFYGLSTWSQENYNDLASLLFQKNIIALIVILVLFVGSLNIFSTLMITINEKKYTIGLLKAIGLKNSRIENIFFYYGLTLTSLGIFLGVLFGLFISTNINEILNLFSEIIFIFDKSISFLLSIFGITEDVKKIEFFSKEFYFEKIYTNITMDELVIIIFLTFIFTIVGSIYPIKKLKSLKTNEVLQNE